MELNTPKTSKVSETNEPLCSNGFGTEKLEKHHLSYTLSFDIGGDEDKADLVRSFLHISGNTSLNTSTDVLVVNEDQKLKESQLDGAHRISRLPEILQKVESPNKPTSSDMSLKIDKSISPKKKSPKIKLEGENTQLQSFLDKWLDKNLTQKSPPCAEKIDTLKSKNDVPVPASQVDLFPDADIAETPKKRKKEKNIVQLITEQNSKINSPEKVKRRADISKEISEVPVKKTKKHRESDGQNILQNEEKPKAAKKKHKNVSETLEIVDSQVDPIEELPKVNSSAQNALYKKTIIIQESPKNKMPKIKLKGDNTQLESYLDQWLNDNRTQESPLVQNPCSSKLKIKTEKTQNKEVSPSQVDLNADKEQKPKKRKNIAEPTIKQNLEQNSLEKGNSHAINDLTEEVLEIPIKKKKKHRQSDGYHNLQNEPSQKEDALKMTKKHKNRLDHLENYAPDEEPILPNASSDQKTNEDITIQENLEDSFVKRKHKHKKIKTEENKIDAEVSENQDLFLEQESPKKKKKHKEKTREAIVLESNPEQNLAKENLDNSILEVPRKKKKKQRDLDLLQNGENLKINEIKKNKKTSNLQYMESLNVSSIEEKLENTSMEIVDTSTEIKSTKKKKKKHKEVQSDDLSQLPKTNSQNFKVQNIESDDVKNYLESIDTTPETKPTKRKKKKHESPEAQIENFTSSLNLTPLVTKNDTTPKKNIAILTSKTHTPESESLRRINRSLEVVSKVTDKKSIKNDSADSVISDKTDFLNDLDGNLQRIHNQNERKKILEKSGNKYEEIKLEDKYKKSMGKYEMEDIEHFLDDHLADSKDSSISVNNTPKKETYDDSDTSDVSIIDKNKYSIRRPSFDLSSSFEKENLSATNLELLETKVLEKKSKRVFLSDQKPSSVKQLKFKRQKELIESAKVVKSTVGLLRDAYNKKFIPTPSQAEQLAELYILVDWQLPPLHHVGFASRLKITDKEKLDALGVEMKTGRFSVAEDKIIRKNWSDFCRTHDWPEQEVQPFFAFEFADKRRFLSASARLAFVQYLSKNINDRLPYSVYKRFKKIFAEAPEDFNKGRFTEVEDEIIVAHMKDSDRKNKFHEIGLILKRSNNAVLKRWNTLSKMKRDSSDDFNFKRLKWTHGMFELFLTNLMEVTLSIDVKELKNKEITPEEWEQLAQKMDMSKERLKWTWYRRIYTALFYKGERNVTNIKEKIFNILSSNEKYDDIRTIDWQEIVDEHFPGMHRARLSEIFHELIYDFVPEEKRTSFKKILKYIRRYEGKFASKATKNIQKFKFKNGTLTIT